MNNTTSGLKKLFVAAFLTIIISASAFAVSYTEDISKIGCGASTMGMGKAAVASVNDSNSMFINPAGLGFVNKLEITSMYASLFEGDLNYSLLGASTSTNYGNIGFAIISTGVNQIPSPTSTTVSYFDYYDRLYSVSYAPKAPLAIGDSKLYTGVTAKVFSKGFSDPVCQSGSGFNADLGAMLALKNGTTIGVNLQNVLPSQVIWTTGAKDDITSIAKVGISRRFLQDKLILDIDADIPLFRNVATPLHIGSEYKVNNFLSLRAGMDQSLSASTGIHSNFTAGAGLNIKNIRVDYAYHTYTDGASFGSHFVSITIKP